MSKIMINDAQEIINQYIEGKSSYELASEYKIQQTSICNIIRGDTWKECQRPKNIKQIINSRKKGRKYKELPELSQLQKDVLIGSLLGDGTLKKFQNKDFYNRQNSNFIKVQSKIRKDYIEWHNEIFKDYSTGVKQVHSKEKLINNKIENKIERIQDNKCLSGYKFETYRHPNITKYRKEWYPDGKKIIPKNLKLNPQIIAIWYFDDGSNNYKQRCAVICTHSFTIEEVEKLVLKLEKFNLFPKICKIRSTNTGCLMPMLKFSKESYDNLIKLVKPYMFWNCFEHKIQWHRAKKQWERCGKLNEKQVNEIIELRKTKTAKEIAILYGLHVNTIYRIVSRKSWKHI